MQVEMTDQYGETTTVDVSPKEASELMDHFDGVEEATHTEKSVYTTAGNYVNIRVPTSGTINDHEWEHWCANHGIEVKQNTDNREVILNTDDCYIAKGDLQDILADAIPTGVQLTLTKGVDIESNNNGKKSYFESSNKQNKETLPDTGFDWTELSLEDRLYWAEHWEEVDTGKVVDVDHDDYTINITVQLEWGETFTEGFDIPRPGESHKKLKKIAEHCGYSLTTIEEIEGSTVPIVVNGVDDWMVSNHPKPTERTEPRAEQDMIADMIFEDLKSYGCMVVLSIIVATLVFALFVILI